MRRGFRPIARGATLRMVNRKPIETEEVLRQIHVCVVLRNHHLDTIEANGLTIWSRRGMDAHHIEQALSSLSGFQRNPFMPDGWRDFAAIADYALPYRCADDHILQGLHRVCRQLFHAIDSHPT